MKLTMKMIMRSSWKGVTYTTAPASPPIFNPFMAPVFNHFKLKQEQKIPKADVLQTKKKT